MYICYVLLSIDTGNTYCGITNTPERRLRQHNGELVGGAKYTRRFRPWSYAFRVKGFRSKNEVLSFEWKLKNMKHAKGTPLERRIMIKDTLLAQSRWQHLTE